MVGFLVGIFYGPQLGDIAGPVVGKWNGKELRGLDQGFLGNFQSDPSLAKWEDVWLET